MKIKKKPTVDVLIPAVNEEKIIKKVVKDCLRIKKYQIRVIVAVDSKTLDNTAEEAKKAGATVIHIGKGKGKGNAVKLAIPFLKNEYVVQIDADYQFQPYEIPKLMEPLLKGFDVTLGTRYEKGSRIEEDSVNVFRLIGSFCLSLITSLFAQKRVSDVMAGFKGFKRKVLKDLNPKVDHFGYEAELAIKAAQKKYKILNVPVTYKSRLAGKSNVNSLKHGLLVLETIIKTGLRI